jgi:hypothetical protein
MRKSFITRLERLEAFNEAKRNDLSSLSDEELAECVNNFETPFQ